MAFCIVSGLLAEPYETLKSLSRSLVALSSYSFRKNGFYSHRLWHPKWGWSRDGCI